MRTSNFTPPLATPRALAFASLSGLLICLSSPLAADDGHGGYDAAGYGHHTGLRADGHAPIGVMGDHMHRVGEWMLSYRFMNMHMEGMRSGTRNVSADEVALTTNPLAGETMRMGNFPNGQPRMMNVPGTYRISPISMDMKMHMIGAMYAPSNDITLMAMLHYHEKEMLLQTYRGPAGTNVIGRFTGRTEGLGDTTISALVRLHDDGINHLHLNAGISLPTGSITEKGKVLPPFAGMMQTGPNELVDIDRLGYPMQLGSGSYDLLAGLTYSGRDGDFSWGGQVSGTLRLNDNDEGYRLGNRIEGTIWAAYQWAPWISTSIRAAGYSQGKIDGRDPVITGGMPLFFAGNSGRDQVDLLAGINLVATEGELEGHRLAIEVGGPVYERVNGLQMSNDWSFTIGWQKSF